MYVYQPLGNNHYTYVGLNGVRYVCVTKYGDAFVALHPTETRYFIGGDCIHIGPVVDTGAALAWLQGA
jgi:hypothetical protein